LLAVGLFSCTEEATLVGFNKSVNRLGIYYREFNLPVHTIQADSLRSDNVRIFIDEPIDVNLDRLMMGSVNDPYFGKIDTRMYMQYLPALIGARLKKQNATLDKVTFTLLHDYYFYGDTTVEKDLNFKVYKIFKRGLDRNINFFTTSEASLFEEPIGEGTWTFYPDSIRKAIAANADQNANNNVSDSIYVELDRAFGQTLLDSVLTIKDTLDITLIDNFLRSFRGVGVVTEPSNLVMGFNAGDVRSKITLYYNYIEDAQAKKGKYVFTFGNPYCAGFTKVDYNRGNTTLTNLKGKYNKFDAGDGYAYVQAGTGLYARLDLSEFYNFFDTIPNPLLNSVELIVPTPGKTERSHFSMPKNLYYMFLSNNNRFYRPVYFEEREDGAQIEKIAPEFQSAYLAELGENFVAYARGDDSYGLKIPYTTTTDGTYYRAFMTDYFQYQLKLPDIYPPIRYAGLVPSDAPYGKSLNGFSFKKDSVKLRVFYSKALLR